MRMLDESGIISEEMKSIIENTHDLMFVKNKDYIYIAASKSFATNCVRCNDVDDVIGKTDFELFEDQAIAGRYREDDEKLFASGKNMAEFQEEFPDENGKKHLCLTAKYVLHDKKGEPVAIFGQYHDIGDQVEEEVARRRDINSNVAHALSESFFAANYADLQTHKFVTIRAMEYTRKMVEHCETIEQAFETFIQTLVKPKYQNKMRKFCDSSTIAKRLKGKKQIDCEYLSKVAVGWCKASFFPCEWDENGEVSHTLFAVAPLDENIAQEIEDGIKLRISAIQTYNDRLHNLEKSNKDALCMCDINLTRNEFMNFQMKGADLSSEEVNGKLDAFILQASKSVFDPEEKRKYIDMFQCEKLLERFKQGENHISFEHFYRQNPTHTDMVESIFDLMQEPISGEVVGIFYAKELNVPKMSEIVLNASLEKDYPMAALVYADTEEYYLYEVDRGAYCVHKQDYWKAVYHRLSDAVDGQQLEEIRHNLTGEKVVSYLEEHEEFLYPFYGTYRGKIGRFESKFRYIDKKHHLILAILRNITDEELYEQYKYDSEHDLLTGLYNRNTVFDKCRELLNTYPEEQFIMLHLDVRHFHLYNTFFGEDAGDQLLCGIANVLNRMGEEYDYFAHGRIEADVFCVFFPINRGLFEKHIRHSFKELDKFSPNFPLDLAIGTYWVTDSSMSIESMFSRATIAAKSQKKNLFGLISKYDESMDQELKDTHQITSEMTTAIEQKQFEVYLQPKYALRSERMVGSEALVRWKHPKRGMISPGKFIPIFEKNGFIAELDRYMWEQVCRILRSWQDKHKPILPVSVNISRVSMYSHLTVPFLKSLIEKYQINPKYLELELTETAYMDDPEDLKRMLKELQEYGFKILMDDFGSGYSSLNTLRDLPVDVLKLDMKFLSETEYDNRGRAVLSSVVRMSKLLNLPIVAEGVERKEQADYLRSIGCEYVQGFLYAKPMPLSDYEKLLSKGEHNESDNVTEYEDMISAATADVIVEDPLISLGVLEYDKERFAYLRTNKKFLKEFDLIENLKPASKVFCDHMDDKSYAILIRAFANCSEKKKDTVCSLQWMADDGKIRKYHGYVYYHGHIGNYANLVVTFMNVTEIDRIGFESL